MAVEKFTLDQLYEGITRKTLRETSDTDFLSNTTFETSVFDQIDGKIILQNQFFVETDEGIVSSAKIRDRDLVSYQITQGRAIIQTDPYTNETLITPKGDEPVKVRTIFDSTFRGDSIRFVGQEEEIGIDIRNVPPEQLRFEKGGGGACASSLFLGEPFEFELRVRSFMPANVIPLSLDRRQINWRHALYFAQDPKIGLMRIRYNPDFQTQTNLVSANKKAGEDFFPADGQNDLYFVMEMLNLGLSCFNKKPMRQTYRNTEWPPYSTVLTIDEPVEFFNAENPDHLMMKIHKNDMQIYDYSSIDVECVSFEIDHEGLLKSRWHFSNQGSEQVIARWFALGDFEEEGKYPSQGGRLLGPKESGYHEFDIDFTARVKKSSLSQFVTMNIVSLNDPVLMGTERRDFQHPAR